MAHVSFAAKAAPTADSTFAEPALPGITGGFRQQTQAPVQRQLTNRQVAVRVVQAPSA